ARTNEPAPEGAWGSTTSTGRVSRQSLEEAEALPAAAPAGTGRWAVRGLLAAAALVAGAGAWWGFGTWSRNRLEAQAIAKAEALLKEDKQLPGEAVAEVQRAIGEYYLHVHKAEQARIKFQEARSPVAQDEAASRERDFVLADLAASQAEL